MHSKVPQPPDKPIKIAFFIVGFKRYFQMVQTIREIRSTSNLPIFVALDGLKDNRDYVTRENFKKYVMDQFAEVRIFEGRRNLGCALGVVSAIDYLFDISESSNAAILEDDCLPTPEFIEKIETHLKELESSELMISGQNPLVSEPEMDLFTSYPMIHGWAISRNNWFQVRRYFSIKKGITFQKRIPWKAKMFWRLNMLKVEIGLLDTWDSHFVWASWLMKQPIRLLGQGQVRNVGYVSTRDEHIQVQAGPQIHLSSVSANHCLSIDEVLLRHFFGINSMKAVRWFIQGSVLKFLLASRRGLEAQKKFDHDMRHNFREFALRY